MNNLAVNEGRDMSIEEKIFDRLNDNAQRITTLETKLESMSANDDERHTRLENKVDELMELLVGVRYMAKAFRWIGGLLFAVGLWAIHEWETIKRILKV